MNSEQTHTEPDGVYMRSTTFRILQQCIGGLGGKETYLGTAGSCRYCGTTDRQKFKKRAHTVAEGLGNKWIFSLDECDDCNHLFSRYETALTASVGAFLTLGGVKGKKNKVRQTGRSAGPTYVEHANREGRRSLSTMINGLDPKVGWNPSTGEMRFTFPIANEKFRPFEAHKAVLKIGYALLPDDERGQYETIRRALLEPAAQVGNGPHPVGLSFAMVGNSPAYVSATLARRCDERLPRTLVVVTAGSLCLVTQLRSDAEEDPAIPLHKINFQWTTHLGSEKSADVISFRYSEPTYFDWSPSDTIVQPIESMTLDFDPRTTIGSFTPTFREA